MNSSVLAVDQCALTPAVTDQQARECAGPGADYDANVEVYLVIASVFGRPNSGPHTSSNAGPNQSPLGFLCLALAYGDLTHVCAWDAEGFAAAIDRERRVSRFDHFTFDLFPVLLFYEDFFVGSDALD